MATAVLDHRMQYPESPLDPDDTPYPCKGCGEVGDFTRLVKDATNKSIDSRRRESIRTW